MHNQENIMIIDSNLNVTDKSTDDEYVFEVTPIFDSEFNPCKSSGVLKKVCQKNKSKYGISNIASMTHYVHKDVLIDDLVSELDKHPKLLAVGMVDDNQDVVGVIIRREVFNILARSYGDDFSKNRPVSSVAVNVQEFHYNTNIITVAEIIQDEMMDGSFLFYLLVNTDHQFCGIFHTRDMMVYLAKMSQRDLETAARLQSSIVNEKLYKKTDFLEITASAVMAKGVGGDFYSIKKLTDTHWFINIADVSGKGIGASFITAIIGALAHTYDFKKGTKKFITKLNEYIFDTFNAERFLTGIFSIFNEEDGTMRIWDMGHSFIYIFRNGKIHTVKTDDSNIPIGITPKIDPESKKIKLMPSDIVILTTDGIVEQMNDHRELYGMDRFSKLIVENTDKSLDILREEILKDMEVFRGSEPQYDDTTFLIFKYTPEEK